MKSSEALRRFAGFGKVGRGLLRVAGGCGDLSRADEGSSLDDEMRLGCTVCGQACEESALISQDLPLKMLPEAENIDKLVFMCISTWE
jgi:hypothetical protein